jgi:hypothetical protein
MTRQKTAKQAAKTMPKITVTATDNGMNSPASVVVYTGRVGYKRYLLVSYSSCCSDSHRSIDSEASADNACCD